MLMICFLCKYNTCICMHSEKTVYTQFVNECKQLIGYKKTFRGKTETIAFRVENRNLKHFNILDEINISLLELITYLSIDGISLDGCSGLNDLFNIVKHSTVHENQNVTNLFGKIQCFVVFFKDFCFYNSWNLDGSCRKYITNVQDIQKDVKVGKFTGWLTADKFYFLHTLFYCEMARYSGISLYAFYGKCNNYLVSLVSGKSYEDETLEGDVQRFGHICSLIKLACDVSLCGKSMDSVQTLVNKINAGDGFNFYWIYAFCRWKKYFRCNFINCLEHDLTENDLCSKKYLGSVSDRVDTFINSLNEYSRIPYKKKTEYTFGESLVNFIRLKKYVARLVGVDSKLFSYRQFMSLISCKSEDTVNSFFSCCNANVEKKHLDRMLFMSNHLLLYLSNECIDTDVTKLEETVPQYLDSQDVFRQDHDLIKLLQATYLMKTIRNKIVNVQSKFLLNNDVFMTLTDGEAGVLQTIFADL